MGIWRLTNDDVEAIVTQLEAGKSMQEVAADLQISVEMVFCATRKAGFRARAGQLPRPFLTRLFA